MGIGFRKSFKIAPGVRLNIGKKGVGISAGVKGFRYSINSNGQRRTTASIPGTGLSYSTTSRSSAYQRHRELQSKERERQKLEEVERNRLEVNLFENKLEMIKSIHIEADEPIDWYEVKDSIAPTNKHEKEASQELENYKPGFISKIFKQDEKKRNELEANIQIAKSLDLDEYKAWHETIMVANRVIDGEMDAYFEVIEEFAPFDDLSEFGSGFEFFAIDETSIEIEFDVHSEEVIPKEQLSLTKTGKISRKQMPKGKYYDIQQDYVCSCIIRIARDIFALLPLKTVYIHAMDEFKDTSTGHRKRIPILSVKIDKNTLNRFNFEQIDCSDAMENFIHNMKFKKTAGFSEVAKLKIEETN